MKQGRRTWTISNSSAFILCINSYPSSFACTSRSWQSRERGQISAARPAMLHMIQSPIRANHHGWLSIAAAFVQQRVRMTIGAFSQLHLQRRKPGVGGGEHVNRVRARKVTIESSRVSAPREKRSSLDPSRSSAAISARVPVSPPLTMAGTMMATIKATHSITRGVPRGKHKTARVSGAERRSIKKCVYQKREKEREFDR